MESVPYPGHPRPVLRSFQNYAQHRLETYIVETSMHTGTHIDAPKHMAPGGKDVASLALEDLVGTAVIVDVSGQIAPLTMITPEMIERALRTMGDQVREGDIFILYTGWQQQYGARGRTPDVEHYFLLHPGPSNDLVDWLIERKVKWVALDGPSFEHPLNIYLRTLRPDAVVRWEEETGHAAEDVFPRDKPLYAHQACGRAGIPHVDGIGGDIALVANQRVDVGCFPWRFVGGEACGARVVAFVTDENRSRSDA